MKQILINILLAKINLNEFSFSKLEQNHEVKFETNYN